MTGYKAMARRLARLEQAYVAWVNSLSDAELDALCGAIPPERQAVFDAMTFDELERLANGRMPEKEWQRHLHRARQHDTT